MFDGRDHFLFSSSPFLDPCSCMRVEYALHRITPSTVQISLFNQTVVLILIRGWFFRKP